MVAIPVAAASAGLRQVRVSPHQTICPPDGGMAPESILIRVDLPAPLAPIKPWIAAPATSNVAFLSAAVPFG